MIGETTDRNYDLYEAVGSRHAHVKHVIGRADRIADYTADFPNFPPNFSISRYPVEREGGAGFIIVLWVSRAGLITRMMRG